MNFNSFLCSRIVLFTTINFAFNIIISELFVCVCVCVCVCACVCVCVFENLPENI